MATLTAGPRTPDTEELQLAGQLLHLVLAEHLQFEWGNTEYSAAAPELEMRNGCSIMRPYF